MNLTQYLVATVLFHGLTPPFDKSGFRVHNWEIVGLAISLAGSDVLADIISGARILIDRPYRTWETGSSCPRSIPGET